MDEIIQSDWRYASGAMRIWRKVEVEEGLSFGWQVLAFLAALAAIFSRLPGTLLHRRFLAEDGWVCYQQAYNLGWLRPLLNDSGRPPPDVTATGGGCDTAFSNAMGSAGHEPCGRCSSGPPRYGAAFSTLHDPGDRCQFAWLMVAIYIALPNAPEVHILLTNAMWHLAVLQALLALSVPPFGWRGRISDIILFAVGSVGGPFSMLLLPSVAAYYWIRRRRWTLLILSIMSLGISIQIYSVVRSVKHAAVAPLGATPVT